VVRWYGDATCERAGAWRAAASREGVTEPQNTRKSTAPAAQLKVRCGRGVERAGSVVAGPTTPLRVVGGRRRGDPQASDEGRKGFLPSSEARAGLRSTT
jgi:hypothetical protein